MAESTSRGASAVTRATWPYQGAPQVLVLVAGLITTVASFLPWLDTPLGSVSGVVAGGTVTFYAAVIALPGAVWRRRSSVLAHALLLAAVAIVVPVWRLVWALQRLPGPGRAWLPGPGLVLVLISGGVALLAAVRLLRRRRLQG